MTLVLVRDDDANATTDPVRLERLYAPLLDAGIPLNLAVIPEVALDTLAPDGGREHFLPRDLARAGGSLPLQTDSPLARWLSANSSQVSVLMHGLSHARRRATTEFGALAAAEARPLLSRGLRILTEALGQSPTGFVAPWDALSRDALMAAVDAFDLVSTGWVDRRRLPPQAWPAHALERLSQSHVLGVGHGWVLRHDGCRIHEATRAHEIAGIVDALTRRPTIAVIVLHHWMYWDHADQQAVMAALARALRAHRAVSASEAIRCLDELPWHHPVSAVGRRALRRLTRPALRPDLEVAPPEERRAARVSEPHPIPADTRP
jgi:hypothetical protein